MRNYNCERGSAGWRWIYRWIVPFTQTRPSLGCVLTCVPRACTLSFRPLMVLLFQLIEYVRHFMDLDRPTKKPNTNTNTKSKHKHKPKPKPKKPCTNPAMCTGGPFGGKLAGSNGPGQRLHRCRSRPAEGGDARRQAQAGTSSEGAGAQSYGRTRDWVRPAAGVVLLWSGGGRGYGQHGGGWLGCVCVRAWVGEKVSRAYLSIGFRSWGWWSWWCWCWCCWRLKGGIVCPHRAEAMNQALSMLFYRRNTPPLCRTNFRKHFCTNDTCA